MKKFYTCALMLLVALTGCNDNKIKSKDGGDGFDGGDSDTQVKTSTDTVVKTATDTVTTSSSESDSDSTTQDVPSSTTDDTTATGEEDAGDGSVADLVCDFSEACNGAIPSLRQICLFSLTPTVDGNLDDAAWSEAHWEMVDSTMGPTPGDSNDDVSFEFACVADEQYMYFGFRIKDDTVYANESPGCESYEDDAIEIYVDQCYERADSYDGDEAQIILGAENVDVTDPAAIQLGGCYQTIEGTETNTVARAVSVTGGWNAEMAVPLSLTTADNQGWNIVPTAGKIIGFQTHYNDDDDGDSRDHKLIWGTSDRDQDGSWDNPTLFDELQFCPVETPSTDTTVDAGPGATDTETDSAATDTAVQTDTATPSDTASDTVIIDAGNDAGHDGGDAN